MSEFKKFTITLDNTENDRTLDIKLPTVPRIGDWICLDDNQFTGGDFILRVKRIMFTPDSETIFVSLEAFD